MGVFNFIITICVGVVVLVGAGITYRQRAAEAQFVQNATHAAINDMTDARASLPKWDDKNSKGLVYRP